MEAGWGGAVDEAASTQPDNSHEENLQNLITHHF